MNAVLASVYSAVFIVVCILVLRAVRRSIFWASVAAMLLGTAFLVVVFPGVRVFGVTIVGIAMLIQGSDLPLPVPSFALWSYLALILVGVLLAVSASDAALAEFVRPIRSFFSGDTSRLGQKLRTPVLFVVFPLVAGGLVFASFLPPTAPPVVGRQAHPSINYDEKLENPLRNPTQEMLVEFKGSAEKLQEAALRDGRHLYAKNCSHCHGGKVDGTGFMAVALKVPPADFTDPGTIATIVEPYAFKRIEGGGIGLPAAGTPWDSSMPRWKDELTKMEIFKILLAEYDLAGVSPRLPEKLE